jgi:hypothetical protein
MIGSVIEIIPNELQRATEILGSFPGILEVQTFGDRINVVVKQGVEPNAITEWLASKGVQVRSSRTIQPSLENVFIALLREQAPSETDTLPIEEKVSADA